MSNKKPLTYRVVQRIIDTFYPELQLVGMENIPADASIIVGNHAHAHGPIISELRLPFEHMTWCIGSIMNRSEAADYAYTDFWSAKPGPVRWFYRLLSRIIAAPISTVLSAAATIPVYHDSRILATMKKSIEALSKGSHLVIFPEHYRGYNHFLCEFQDGFIDTARLYFRRSGKCLAFVPMYVAPELKKVFFGKPVRFDPKAPPEEERVRINGYLMKTVSDIAMSQELHTVIPYPNISRRDYPQNIEGEVISCGTQSI